MDLLANYRSVIYRELYNYLTSFRAAFSDSSTGRRPPAASAVDLPRPLARSLVHFYTLLKAETVGVGDDDLADQIALAVSDWFVSIWDDLESSAPMETAAEQRALKCLADPTQLEKHLTMAERAWPEYNREWTAIRDHLRLVRNELQQRALYTRFMDQRRKVVRDRRNLRRERAIRLVANPLADHLNEVVPHLLRNQEEVRSVFGINGRWSILDTEPCEINWKTLKRYRRYLDRAPGLLDLCRLVVHGIDGDRPGSREVEDVEISRMMPVEVSRIVDQGLGEIDGVAYGTDSTLPLEIGLLTHRATEDLFFHRFSEGTLLALHHCRRRTVTDRSMRMVRERYRQARSLGPVILCIDTSGSMRGVPEDVAKATLLGVFREALRARRPVIAVVFTRELEVLATSDESRDTETDLSASIVGAAPPSVSTDIMEQLTSFLDASFTEGSDLSPAMDFALGQVESSTVARTFDVIVVSDVRFPRLPPRQLNRMYNAQNGGAARFHALTVHEEPIYDPLNIFDYRWFYNTSPKPAFDLDGSPQPIGLDMQSFRQF
jgi:hypothetical protein